MPLRRLTLVAVAIAATLFSTLSYGQATPPVADTLTYSNNPNTNYGSYTALFVQKGSITSSSYIKFNLATLPAGATVSKATLRLFVNQVAANGSFDVYQLNTSWAESTLTYNNAPALGTSATGNHPIAFTTSTLNQFVVIDITPLVQGWANGSITNDGLALALTTSSGAVAFDSKESIYTSHQPELEIALTGPAGPAGPQGPQGPTGIAGPAGPAGATGATGATGPQGPIGLTGSAGATGATGPQGPMGLTGAQGPAGTNGTNGTNGTSFTFRGTFHLGGSYNMNDVVADANGSSYIAITANNGPSDPANDPADWTLMAQAGAAGATGPAGPTGSQGPAGPMGATGSQGPQGQTGATGATGPQGTTGATGPQGPQGTQGPIGLTGPQGPAGTNGTNGTSFTFRGTFHSGQSYNVNDVVADANGSSYIAITANNGPSDPANDPADWTLMAQAGAAGATGPAGPTGSQGPAGPMGATGSQGPQGQTGATGATGPQGTTGATGPQGPQGTQGPIGLTGPQGPAGTNGTNGTSFTFRGTFHSGQSYNVNDVVADANGSSYIAITANHGSSDPANDPADWTLMAQAGAPGATGPAGSTGSQGPAGPTGATGAQGPQGPQGTTGATGPQGPQGPQGPAGTVTLASVCAALQTGGISEQMLQSLGCSSSYPVGGTVSGLLTGGTLVLGINVAGVSPLSITTSGAFTFGNITTGTNYTISIITQPAGQTCTITGASGTAGLNSANATTVSCPTQSSYPVGGTVSGLLTGGTLVLNINYPSLLGTNLNITTNGAFTYGNIPTGTNYTISVAIQPAGQTCTVSGASGIAGPYSANATTVSCSSQSSYPVGGTVIGLAGGTLGLGINVAGVSPLSITTNGAFTFGNITTGTNYTISITSQPSGETCALTGASGTSNGASANATTVSCASTGTSWPNVIPVGIAFDGTDLWVAASGSPNTLNHFSSATGQLLASFPIDAGYPAGIVYDGTNFWVSFNNAPNVLLRQYSPNGVLLQTSVNIPYFPVSWMTFASELGSKHIFVSAGTSVIDMLSDGNVHWGQGTGFGSPGHSAYDGTNLWVVNGSGSGSGVTELGELGQALGSVGIPNASSITFDGTNLWVGTLGTAPGVTVVGPSRQILATYSTPFEFGYMTFDGTHIWGVSDQTSPQPQAAELNLSNGTVLNTYSLGGTPVGMVFDGHNIWTVNTSNPPGGAATLTQIPVM